MKILIVGAGIGGLTLGAFLEECGLEYEIVEKCPDWSHQGYVIGLWDNGRDILAKLRLAEKLDRAGSRTLLYSVRDGEGRVLRDFSLMHFYSEYGGAVTIIGRKELHELLLEKVPASKIRMKCSVTSLVQKEGKVAVTFSDGRVQDYDVVVGADGIHSVVRKQAFGIDAESFSNWRAWYMWIDNSYDVPATIVEYIEPREFIVTFASGGKTLACLIAPADHEKWDTQEGRVERLEKLFKDEKHIVPAALAKLKDADVMPTDIVDVNMSHFYKGNVVLAGDAAHSFGPMAGLGTSMAMEDAYTLAGELLRSTKYCTLGEALATYEKRRRKRVAIARRISMKLRTAGLIKSSVVAWLFKTMAPYVPETLLASDYRKLLKEEI